MSKCEFIKIMERTQKRAVSLNIAYFSLVSPNVVCKTGLDDQNILKVMLQVTSTICRGLGNPCFHLLAAVNLPL